MLSTLYVNSSAGENVRHVALSTKVRAEANVMMHLWQGQCEKSDNMCYRIFVDTGTECAAVLLWRWFIFQVI